MQRGAPGAKQKEAQGKVAHKVAAFSDVVMHHLEAGRIQADQEVKQGVQKSAGVFCGKRIGGLDRDQRHPQQRGNPGFE